VTCLELTTRRLAAPDPSWDHLRGCVIRPRSRTVRSLMSRESARLLSSGRGSRRTVTVASGRSDLRGALHSTSLRDSYFGGRRNRPVQSQRQCARRSDRPKRRTVALRASVGSTEATSDQSASVSSDRRALRRSERGSSEFGRRTMVRGQNTRPLNQVGAVDGDYTRNPHSVLASDDTDLHVESAAAAAAQQRDPDADW
jgi:hypothetical protein